MFRAWFLAMVAAVGILALACEGGGEPSPTLTPTPTPTPPPTSPTPTATPGPTEEPRFGPYTFALEVGAEEEPLDVVETVPAGVDVFYVFVDYTGMTDGVQVGFYCVNTDLQADYGPPDYYTWDFGSEGTTHFGCATEDGSPLPPGSYDVYITMLGEAGEEVILVDNDPAADILVEEASATRYPTPEDAIAAAVTAAGAEYAGDCAGTDLETDIGKLCSSWQDQQGDILAYLVGPTFSEFTDWFFVQGSDAQGYVVTDTAPFDPADPDVPWQLCGACNAP